METLPTDPAPELPVLDAGMTLLTSDRRATGALQSLVLDHLLLSEGQATWIDAESNAATTSLARIAPSRRILDRIRVARAFTAFQHYSLVNELEAALSEETTLVIAPSVEWFYANDDLYEGESEEMLRSALEILRGIATEYDVPVLVSRRSMSGVGRFVDEYCDAEIEYFQTKFGPRFSGDGYETLVFECQGGVQTTLSFWRKVLEARHAPQVESDTREVTHVGSY